MSREAKGLVTKKKVVRPKQIPRLLQRMLAELPPAPLTKEQVRQQTESYAAFDHFDFNQEQKELPPLEQGLNPSARTRQ
jgi:hypothetical protein